MRRSAFQLSLCFPLLLTLACSRDLPEAERVESDKEIVIVFNLPGDDFASAEDLEMRDAVAAAIAAGGLGEITRRESGMGSMEIGVRLKKAGAISAIKKLLFDSYPEARYRIER